MTKPELAVFLSSIDKAVGMHMYDKIGKEPYLNEADYEAGYTVGYKYGYNSGCVRALRIFKAMLNEQVK